MVFCKPKRFVFLLLCLFCLAALAPGCRRASTVSGPACRVQLPEAVFVSSAGDAGGNLWVIGVQVLSEEPGGKAIVEGVYLGEQELQDLAFRQWFDVPGQVHVALSPVPLLPGEYLLTVVCRYVSAGGAVSLAKGATALVAEKP